MIKVRQNLSAVSAVENKEIEKLKNDLKKDFQSLYNLKEKLESDNKKLRGIIEQAKLEYQQLNKEKKEQVQYTEYYKEYAEELAAQINDLNMRMEQMEHQRYYYPEPSKKKPRYVQESDDDEEQNREGLDYVEKKPPKKTARKVGLSKYIKH